MNLLRNTLVFFAMVFGIVIPMHADTHERIVYGSSLSPYVLKVLVAMEEMGLEYHNIETLPLAALRANKQEPLAEFVQASPLGKIPAYREGDFTLSDSSVIIAYLDRQYPKRALFPSDPKAFAKVFWFEKYADETMSAVTHGKILTQKVVMPKLCGVPCDEAILQKAITQELPPVLAFIEQNLQGKRWICGDLFTAADIALGTQLNILDTCGVPISAEQYPHLAAYKERLFARDSFKKFLRKG
jgi:glutathione S-transferase